MRKKYTIFLIIIAILLFLIIGLAVYGKFFYKPDENKKSSNIIHSLEDYGYTLDDRDSKLMHNIFKELEKVLDEEEVDKESYAKLLSELFIVDLYSINNKINKYDVGSLEYILDSEKDKFKNLVMDTIYEQVKDNSNNKRNQQLPEVASVEVKSINESSIEMDGVKNNCYEIKLSWNYVEDLGYDNAAIIKVIEKENKMYVVEYTPTTIETETGD